MKFKLGFAKIISKPKRSLIQLTPQEKFNRISAKFKKGKIKLRKYHFNAIESGKVLTVFDGEGIEVFQGENSVKGCRVARQCCLAIFLSAINQNGGFTFTTNANFEFQTLDELRLNHAMMQKHLDHKNLPVCINCKFQFSDETDKNMHLCTENWMIFEFRQMRRQYA